MDNYPYNYNLDNEENKPRIIRRSRSRPIFRDNVSYIPEAETNQKENLIEILRGINKLTFKAERENKLINVISNIKENEYMKEILFLVIMLLK